jgi:hypothetical protein
MFPLANSSLSVNFILDSPASFSGAPSLPWLFESLRFLPLLNKYKAIASKSPKTTPPITPPTTAPIGTPLVPVFELLVEYGLFAGGGPDVVGGELWWLVLDPSVVPVVGKSGGNVEVGTVEVVVVSVVEVGTVLDNKDELVGVTAGVAARLVVIPVPLFSIANKGVKL